MEFFYLWNCLAMSFQWWMFWKHFGIIWILRLHKTTWKKKSWLLCYRVINFHLLTRDIRWMSLQMTVSEFETEEISPSPAVSLSILCSTIPRHSPWEKLSTYHTMNRRNVSSMLVFEISNSKLSLNFGEYVPCWTLVFESSFDMLTSELHRRLTVT